MTQSTIKFLGVHFNSIRIWPDPKKRESLSKKLSSIVENSRNVRDLLNSINNLLEGWIAAYGFCDLNENYMRNIDSEVSRVLWKGLKKFGWVLKPKYLNYEQRTNSGIKSIHCHLKTVRRNLNQSRKVFSKYWSKPET